MKMTVEQYLELSSVEAGKVENITALLKGSDRALYDLEQKAGKKLSPAFLERAMQPMANSKDFDGSFKRYQSKGLHPLSNMKLFYDRITEYSVEPVKAKNLEKNDVHRARSSPRP